MASYQLSGDNAVDTTVLSLLTHFMFQESVRGRSWRAKRILHHLLLKKNLLISLSVLPCTLIFISSFFFRFFFLDQAKFTLTFNHHGLTLHQAKVDVLKLKTFQLQRKTLKPWGMLNQLQGPPLSELQVWRRKLVKYDSSTVHICAKAV